MRVREKERKRLVGRKEKPARHKSDNDLEVFAGREAAVTTSKLCPLVYSQGQRRETMAIDLALKRRGGKA